MGIKRHIGGIILLIGLLICLSQVIIAGNTRSEDNAHLLLNQSLNGRDVIDIEKTGEDSAISFNYALWGEVNEQMIENPDFNRQHNTTVIYIRGKTELILNHTGYLDTNDENGCLIDEESAWQLFGDSDAIGRTITYDGKEYIIQGILEDIDSLLVIPVTSKTTEVINRVCLEIPEGKYRQDIIESFKSIYGIDATEVEYHLYKFSLTQEFIPNEWSDFEFFTNLYQEKLQSIQLLLGTENPKPMMPYVNAFWQTLKYGILSVILFIILHMIVRIQNRKTLFLYVGSAFIGAFLCVVIFQNVPQAVRLADSRSLWLAPSVYFLGRYAIYRCRNFSKTR